MEKVKGKTIQKYAFISYSSRNQQSADAVRMLLTNSNISSWMAPYDIPVGSKYAYEINDAIEGCACLVLLLTEESQESEFVEKEVERAITYKKPIIPLQLGNITLNSGFKYYLGNSQIMAITKINENSEEWIKARQAIKSFTSTLEKHTIKAEKNEHVSYPYKVKTGRLENAIDWKLESNGDLYIEGDGNIKCAAIYGQTLDKVMVVSHLKEIQKNVIRLFIGEGIRNIGEFSFYEFPELTEVYIPITVKRIGAGAFKNCRKLRYIEMPLTLEVIDTGAFENCDKLEDFELPDKVVIGSEAFKNCISLTKLDKCGKSIAIYQNVFENCKNLNYISLHNVEFIGACAFKGCPIQYVDISFQSSWLKHTMDGRQTIQSGAFASSGVKEIHLTFPNMLMSTALFYDIGDHCFDECEDLTDIFFEEAIPYICNEAFTEDLEICVHVNKRVYGIKWMIHILENKCKSNRIECID